MKYERFPAGCAQSHSGSSQGTAGKEGPAGGDAAPAGPHHDEFPLGRTKESAPPSQSQSGYPMAGTDGAPTTPPVDAAPVPAPSAGGATFSGMPVRAIEDVMAARMEQILRFGHTIEADRQRALWSAREFDHHGERSLMRAIAAQFSSAIEYASRGAGHHDVARRNLVKTAALCLAAIDWIDAELEELAQPPPPIDPEEPDDFL